MRGRRTHSFFDKHVVEIDFLAPVIYEPGVSSHNGFEMCVACVSFLEEFKPLSGCMEERSARADIFGEGWRTL